jgi:hypothetical protein
MFLLPLDSWRLKQPPAWLLVAEPQTSDGERHMWITPARFKFQAAKGLDELADHIALGRPLAEFGIAPEGDPAAGAS